MASSPLAFIGNVVTLGFTGAEYSRGETIRLGDADLPPLPIPFKSSKSCSRLIDFDG